MTSPAAVTPDRPFEHLDMWEILERLLTGPVDERVKLFVEGCRRPWSTCTVVDHACADDGLPRLVTFTQLWPHLKRFDSPARILTRGHRMHTPQNVEWGSPDAKGSGPAKGRGQ
jgi:hypothetical protein